MFYMVTHRAESNEPYQLLYMVFIVVFPSLMAIHLALSATDTTMMLICGIHFAA